MTAESLLKIQLLQDAINAEVQGMIAENKQCELLGESMAYQEDSFLIKANELRKLGDSIT